MDLTSLELGSVDGFYRTVAMHWSEARFARPSSMIAKGIGTHGQRVGQERALGCLAVCKATCRAPCRKRGSRRPPDPSSAELQRVVG